MSTDQMSSGEFVLRVEKNPVHGDRWREQETGRVAVVLANSSTPSHVPDPGAPRTGAVIATGPDNPAISGYFEDDFESFAMTRAGFWADFSFPAPAVPSSGGRG